MSRMPSVKGAWRAYRSEGVGGVLARAARLRSRMFSFKTYSLQARVLGDLDDLLPARFAKIMRSLTAGIETEWMDANTTGALREYLEYRQQPRLSESRVRDWLAAGHATVLARDRGRIVGDCWLALETFPLPAASRAFDAGMRSRGLAYSYMVYVDPASRGRGIFPLLLAAHGAAARAQGRRGLLGILLERSISSKRTLQAMEFDDLGSYRVLGLAGRNYARTVWRDGK